MRAIRLALSLAVALGCAAPLVATAAGKADAASVEEARKRMQKGQSLFAQGSFADAATEFEAAHQAQAYSAFLYNAALSYERAGDKEKALARYRDFLTAEPNAPDAGDIRAAIRRLEGGAPADAAQPAAAGSMRSLVLIESDPPGAPFSVYAATSNDARPYREGDPAWKKVGANLKTPQDLSLVIGRYHIVVDAFQDYRRSETDITLAPGHVYTFKANLSQGAFLAFVKIASKVEGAMVFLDDPPPHKKAPWGRTPHDGLVPDGEHEIWIEAPGREPFSKKITAKHGDVVEIEAELPRVGYGYLVLDGNADKITIKVDGTAQDAFVTGTSGVRIKVPAGTHKVDIDASGKKAFEGPIEIPRGQELPVHANLIDSPSRVRPIVTGVLAIGAGVAGGVLWKQAQDTPKTDNKHDIFQDVAIGCFIGAGVFTIASVWGFVYDPTPDSRLVIDRPREFSEAPKSAARFTLHHLAPYATSSGGGALFGGSF